MLCRIQPGFMRSLQKAGETCLNGAGFSTFNVSVDRMGKFDFRDVVGTIKASYNKDQARANQFGVGNDLSKVSNDPHDFVVLPEWWKRQYGILGLPFGKWVQISGKPDAGKTSLALLAMRCAQEQGFGILYVETEDKTGPEDLISAGINPEEVMVLKTNLTEEVFEGVNRALDAFFDQYPEDKMLVILDSYGNTTSLRDSELDQTHQAGLVGGAAKSNRLGLGAIRARQTKNHIAMLVVNYSYKSIGFGVSTEVNAGGRALEFFCSLVISASRKAWYEKTIRGVKVRAGADVLWKSTKNHFAKSLQQEDGSPVLLPKEIVLRIDSTGIFPVEKRSPK